MNAALPFLHGMYLNGCLYGAARSALSSVVTIKGFIKLSDHPLIAWYLKGIYNKHPVLPKYSNTCNSNTCNMLLLLKYYNNININEIFAHYHCG